MYAVRGTLPEVQLVDSRVFHVVRDPLDLGFRVPTLARLGAACIESAQAERKVTGGLHSGVEVLMILPLAG